MRNTKIQGGGDPSAAERLGSVWAKSQEDGRLWLSLKQHLRDTAAVADALWLDYLAPAQRRMLGDQLGGEKLARKVAVWLAASHDLGKCSVAFATKVPTLARTMQVAGYQFVPLTRLAESEAPHWVVGQLSLIAWLTERGWRPKDARFFGLIVGGHHGNFPTTDVTSAIHSVEPEAIRREPHTWAADRAGFLDGAAALADLTAEDLDRLRQLRPTPAVQAMLTGFLIQCDWTASNTELFPLEEAIVAMGSDGTSETPRSTTTLSTDRSRIALSRLALPPVWTPAAQTSSSPNALFSARFTLPEGARPHPSQTSLVEVANACSARSFLLLEAPTGEGKTEAALAAAEVLAARFGLGGVFVALPTRATSDAMFSRVLSWLRKAVPAGVSASTVLSHGKAEFNDEYRELFAHPRPGSVVYDDELTGAGQGSARPIAHQSLRGRKTSILASFVVGTIDQLLFMALKSRHLVLRHWGLSGKVVIIDEIHASDVYTTAYLTRSLEWLGALGVPVIGLSATLPPDRRAELVRAYQRGARTTKSGKQLLPEPSVVTPAPVTTVSYPVVLAADLHSVTATPCERSGRSAEIWVEAIGDDLHELVDRVRAASLDGGCIAVIRNTVARAQEVYARLQSEFASDEVVLLHSRFLANDRQPIEKRIVLALGARAATRPHRLIVVATQVIESSLDLDFDLLITDFAPLDLIIQRAGRLHRHNRALSDRPPLLRAPRIVLTGASKLLSSSVPTFDRGSEFIYGSSYLLRSAATLGRHVERSQGRIRTPDDVVPLVHGTYATDFVPPAGWGRLWEEAEELRLAKEARKRAEADAFRIASPDSKQPLDSWSRASAGEASEEQRGRAQVRDADESIPVVMVQNVEGRLRSLPWLPEPFAAQPLDGPEIGYSLARAIAQCSVNLPAHWLPRDPDEFNKVIDLLEAQGTHAWRQSRWLAGAVPLVVDTEMSGVLGKFHFRYDRELGLREIEGKEN